MILQNKVISGPISFPCVASTAPAIIYAPTLLYKPTPLSVPVVTSQKQSSILSSHIVQGQQSSNMYTHVTNCGKTLENLIKAPIVGNSGGNIPKVVHESGVRGNEPSVSVQNVTIVVGKDGVHYDKSTGKPYKYPDKKKYVVAGPKGKFYDKATGYEVDVPQSENLKHVPGTVYLASEVSFTKEVQEFLKKKRKKEGTSKKCKKSKNVSKELTSSDEEFAKMLETEMAKTSEEESDDIDYDYEKISQRVRMARSKKLPVRQQHGTMDIEDQERKKAILKWCHSVLGNDVCDIFQVLLCNSISRYYYGIVFQV
ncbi:uncharacterized protein LOC132752689 [Ruditapes philippinarum]|uniref:uncharacterized protein LOC132752689 n=1 Tax=Ruditapes philippinarum TaxID=129788 RepID=UPI00295BE6B4|nr:uncharacterized protein LOC132752689 [Ruditapes philippinarum]